MGGFHLPLRNAFPAPRRYTKFLNRNSVLHA